MTEIVPIIIVAGLDSDSKPHGAQFSQDQTKLATKAAKLMGFGVGLANTEIALAVAKQLPRGRLYASGRAFAPLIKHTVYEQLQQVLTLERDTSAPDVPAGNQPTADPWQQLKVGSVALYGGKYVEEGWWEVIVREISKDGQTMTCVWRGAPKEKPVKCRRNELGIIGPEAIKSLRKV
jgi:hypothetical protein